MALNAPGLIGKRATTLQATSTPRSSLHICRAQPGPFFVGQNGRAGPNDEMVSRDLAPLLVNNREWSRRRVKEDPNYFNKLSNQQYPEYLWVGCADSRVPANVILGLEPGEVFVQRNVGNQALHRDMNCMSCIEFAVKYLRVKTIIVNGHYGCGAVRAALRWPASNTAMVNMWISDIREARNQHAAELAALDTEAQVARLCEINVMRQVFHVATNPVVQEAWKEGQALAIYGTIYSLDDGLLKELVGPIRSNGDVDKDQALEDDKPIGPIYLSNTANPLDTRAMLEKLTLHNEWSNM